MVTEPAPQQSTPAHRFAVAAFVLLFAGLLTVAVAGAVNSQIRHDEHLASLAPSRAALEASENDAWDALNEASDALTDAAAADLDTTPLVQAVTDTRRAIDTGDQAQIAATTQALNSALGHLTTQMASRTSPTPAP